MPLGFDRRHLVEVELADRVLRLSAGEVRQTHEALLAELGALPGVEHVALSMPLFPSWAYGVEQPAGEAGMRVSVDYFAAMRLPLIRGRLLRGDDLTRADPVVVVNEWYANRMFPGEDAIGKRGGFNDALIVGIVANSRVTNVRWEEEPAVYRLALPTGGTASARSHRQNGVVDRSRVAVQANRAGRAGREPATVGRSADAGRRARAIDRAGADGRGDERLFRHHWTDPGRDWALRRCGVGRRAPHARAGPAAGVGREPRERRR